jgi:hypothetical protein
MVAIWVRRPHLRNELGAGAKAVSMPDSPLPDPEWGPYTPRTIHTVNAGGLTARDISARLIQSGTVEDMTGEHEIKWEHQAGTVDALGVGESKDWTLIVLDVIPQFTVEISYKSILLTRVWKRTFAEDRDYL